MQDSTIPNPDDHNQDDQHADGMKRRGFLACMAWTGTGLVWTLTSGILSSSILGQPAARMLGAEQPVRGDFSFVQISDTHIGFKGEANPDVMATLQLAIAKINALQPAPAFLLHTGDLTHGQKAGAFDTLAEALKGVKVSQVFYVPGEHDVFADGGKEYLNRYGNGTTDNGWQRFDFKGAHFIGVVNVLNFTAMSTTFPQPAPGATPSPGPMKVPADQLRRVLGIREVHYVQGQSPLAIVDSTLV